MALNQNLLKTRLAADWLVEEGHPESPAQSAAKLAGVLADWFSMGQANGIPSSTAQARRPQLTGQITQALQAMNAVAAGNALALAVASYIAGQSFGSGVASFPLTTPTAGAQLGLTFADRNASRDARAGGMAGALSLLPPSTLVLFPNPPWVGSIV